MEETQREEKLSWEPQRRRALQKGAMRKSVLQRSQNGQDQRCGHSDKEENNKNTSCLPGSLCLQSLSMLLSSSHPHCSWGIFLQVPRQKGGAVEGFDSQLLS